MRLIDADALMRIYQEVLCPHVSCVDCSLLMNDGNCRFETMIREALAIDAVPATEQEWVSVDESLPVPFESVLVFRDGKISIDYNEENGWFAHDLNGKRATHWMPITQPPKGE